MTDWDCSPELMGSLRSSITPIQTDTPLYQVLMEDFPKDCSDLPISGGWGYSQSDAIILVRSKFPSSAAARNFVSLEYHIVEKIVYEELIIFQEKGNGFSGIRFHLDWQALLGEERKFDRLDFRISCWSDQHWEWLKENWEQNGFGESIGFDREAHLARREASKIEYTRQFWFDITSVFQSVYRT
jgi:hypothetical protein